MVADLPPLGVNDKPLEEWRCPLSNDPIRVVGDVAEGDLMFCCTSPECEWAWMP